MSHRLFYAYARHALVTGLRLLGVTSGSRVLLPDFICRDILASLHHLRAEPVFYSMDDRLRPANQRAVSDVTAVIGVNYFGFPFDINELVSQLQVDMSKVLEDNAHGWLSADESGIPLGHRTAIGITSFRKTIRVPDGAYLHWKDEHGLDLAGLHDPLEPRTGGLPASFRIRSAIAAVDARTTVPTMEFSRRCIRLGRQVLGRAPIAENPLDEFFLPDTRAIHRHSLDVFAKVDVLAETKRRKDLLTRCRELAQDLGIEGPFPTGHANVVPQGFPFFGDDASRTRAFRRSVRRLRLGEVVRWPGLSDSATLPATSRLRHLLLVNFLQ